MRTSHALRGTRRQSDNPDWSALEALLDVELCGHFMWMCEIELEDGCRVDAYKHRWTRHYLHLAEDGRAFIFFDARGEEGLYLEVDAYTAILEAFEGRGCIEFTPAEQDALTRALNVARRRLGRRLAGPRARS